MPGEAVALVVVLALVAALAVAFAVVQRQELHGLRAAPMTPVRDATTDAPDLMQVADLADVGLLRIDHEGLIRQANGAANRFLERPSGELVGRTAIEAFLDHRVGDLMAETRRTGEARREIALGGEPQRTLLLIGTRGDRRADTWIVLQDLSELRRLQRIRTEFIDNLAHELRTPLTNVRLLTETLAMEIERSGDQTSPRVAESVTRIDVETGHLVQMVNELLDLARIEQGGGPQRRDEVDLGRVTESVVDRLRLYADRQEVALRGDMPALSAERTVTGDEERLEQMLLNLVHNAIKFSIPGTDVVVRTRAQPDGVLLEVEDHGPGIPKRDLERIFERFYKVDRARTRGRPGGTGLGLSIARHIAEAHGGRIWAESEEGNGARFFVALPRS
jgi:two-component system, OmpR family, phosphate regulon sensor histidine kinase PhoR